MSFETDIAEAKASGRKFRIERNVQTGEVVAHYLTDAELAELAARQSAREAAEANRPPSRGEAIDALLKEQAKRADAPKILKDWAAAVETRDSINAS